MTGSREARSRSERRLKGAGLCFAMAEPTLAASVLACGLLGCGSAPEAGAPIAASTVVLSGPEGGREAFEPSLAIDPADPGRIVVAAMYGNPNARGGRAIWSWESRDAGSTWAERRMTPPIVGDKAATWAADVIAGFTPDGAIVLTAMGGAADPRTDGLGGVWVARLPRDAAEFDPPVPVLRDRLVGGSDRAVSYDKPWMAIDAEPSSPYPGSIYVLAAPLELDLPAIGWAETSTDLATLLFKGLDLTVSRDGGKTFDAPRTIDDTGFGPDLVVTADGALHAVFQKTLDGKAAVLHLRSTDGGATFEPAEPIATAEKGGSVGAPVLGTRRSGELMACWSERGADETRDRLRCAAGGAGWAARPRLEVRVPDSATITLTRLAGGRNGWYLLAYLVGPGGTDVTLFRSDGATDFVELSRLASIPDLTPNRWCVTRDCRFHRVDLFLPGDYSALAVSGGRVAAAYVLPRPGGGLAGNAAVWVSTLDEPREAP